MKAVCLISNNIKDFVAASIVKKKGYETILVHFYLHSKKTAKNFAKSIKSKIYLFDLEKLHDKIPQSKKKFSCGICKRAMLRTGEKIAEKEGAEILILGEDLNENNLKYMAFLDSNVKIKTAFPVFPFTKDEILKKADEFGLKKFMYEQNVKCPLKGNERIFNINTLGKLERRLNINPSEIIETAEIIK